MALSHGGSVPGSAGCIDLTTINNSFHAGFVRSLYQSLYMLNIQRVLGNELLQNFLGVSITVLILVFILFAAGSGAVIALKLVYCFAFTVCFGGALKVLYGGDSIYQAFTAIILGLIIFDVGTAFFIENRQFLTHGM